MFSALARRPSKPVGGLPRPGLWLTLPALWALLFLSCLIAGGLVASSHWQSYLRAPAALYPLLPSCSCRECRCSPTPKRLLPISRAAAQALDPGLVEQLPAAFNANYRSPCWHGTPDDQLRCLPYFYMLGGFQSGAGSLYSMLEQHPDIATGHNARSQFWAEAEKPLSHFLQELSGALPSIAQAPETKLLGDASESTLAFYFAANQRGHRKFQATLQTCFEKCASRHKHASMQRRCQESYCYPAAQEADKEAVHSGHVPYTAANTPLFLHAAYGIFQPRLVALVRDPVERLHSAFWAHEHYTKRYGASAAGFLNFTREQVGAFSSCEESGHSTLECALLFESLEPSQEQVFFHCDQLLRGLYHIWLEGWMQHFGRDALLVLSSEEYFSSPRKTMDKLLRHLQVLPLQGSAGDATWAAMLKAEHHTSHPADRPVMLPEARKLLQQFYQPFERPLLRLLRVSRLPWAAEAQAKAQALEEKQKPKKPKPQ